MAMNFGGLGFGFGAEDTGAEKAATSVATSLEKVWTGLQKIGPAAASAGRKLGGGLGRIRGMAGKALGGVSLAIASAVESATSPKLDAPFASMFAQFDKTFSSMTAGMKLSSKEAKRMRGIIGSAAFGLNEDMDQAAKSWKAFEQQNLDLQKVLGSKGTAGAIKDLIRVTSVYEVEGEQLANVMAGLRHGFGLTEKQVGTLADQVVSVGREFNMGREAVQAWPAIFESLNAELADFGRTAKPADLQKLTTSIVALGGGLKDSLGLNAQSALELSRTVFTTVMGERKNILNMTRGMGSEISDFSQRLVEAGGSVQGMFEMIQGDPLQFMEMLRKMSAEAEKRGGTSGAAFQRLSATITDALGPNVTFAMKGNWDKVQESMGRLPQVLNESKGAFVGFAKEAHRPGLTAQEQWERTLGVMESRLMRISGPLRKEWVKNMQGGFKSTIGTIEKMAKDPNIGDFTKRLLLVRDVGLSALLPEMGRLSPLFGGIVTSMLPVMTAFGAMGLKFSMLGKMAMGGGALFLFFRLMRDGPEETIKSIKKLGSTVWTFFSELFPGLKKFEKVFDPVMEKFKKFGFSAAVQEAFSIVNWDFIKERFSAGLEKIKEWLGRIDIDKMFFGLSKMFASIPWDKIIGVAFTAIGKVLQGAVKIIKSFIVSTDWVSVATAIGKGLMSAITGVLDILFSPTEIQGKATGPLTAGLTGAFGQALVVVGKVAIGLVKGVFSGLWDYAFGADSVGGAIGRVLQVVGTGFGALLILSKGFRMKMLTGFKGFFVKAGNEFSASQSKIGAGFRSMGAGFKGMIGVMKKAFKAFLITGLIMGFMELLNQIPKRLENISNVMNDKTIPDAHKTGIAGQEAFMGWMTTLDTVLLGIPSKLGKALGVTKEDVLIFYHEMVGEAEKLIAKLVIGWENMALKWKEVVNGMKGTIDVLRLAIQSTWLKIQQVIEKQLFRIEFFLSEKIIAVPKWIRNIMPSGLMKWAEESQKRAVAMGGVSGLEREHAKALQALEDQVQDRITARQLEEDKERRRIEEKKKVLLADIDKATQERIKVSLEREKKAKAKAEPVTETPRKGEEKKGKAPKRPRPVTPKEQAAARTGALPPGLVGEVQSLTGNTAVLARSFAQFTKKPIDVKIEVGAQSGLRKMLKFKPTLQTKSIS